MFKTINSLIEDSFIWIIADLVAFAGALGNLRMKQLKID